MERGAVLLLAMTFLLLLGLLSTAALRSSVLELHMAANQQFSAELDQKARAISAALAEEKANFPTHMEPGHQLCYPPGGGGSCVGPLVGLPSAVAALPIAVRADYSVTRLSPRTIDGMPFRRAEDTVSSALAFDTAMFEVEVSVNGSGVRLGRSDIAQGMAVDVAKAAP